MSKKINIKKKIQHILINLSHNYQVPIRSSMKSIDLHRIALSMRFRHNIPYIMYE